MFKTFLISAAAVALIAPGAAVAQDYGWHQHQQDHAEHGDLHDEVDAGHDEAHERGFNGHQEHRGYHRALRDLHDEFHDDHPGTRHDGYRLPRSRRYYRDAPSGYYSYGRGYSSYGYSPYGYSPYEGSSFSFSFSR